MAEVYKAYHEGLDRYVAIKVLHPFLAEDEDFLIRFQREAKIVAAFRHPNIVQVYDFDHDPDTNAYYMVMEFVDGPNLKVCLRELSEQNQIMPLEEAVRIVTAVGYALDYAHQRGMVHRDVKPANIILAQNGQVILSDFGIARMINTNTLTASGAMVGTPAYMAPEQGLGHAGDERADLYSLGVVLYQLVTGKLPFDADTPLGIVLKHINTPVTPPTAINPNLPPAIESVIVRVLAKDPADRYPTARAFINDLRKAVGGGDVESTPVEALITPTSDATLVSHAVKDRGDTPPPTRSSARWKGMLGGAIALLLIAALVLTATGQAGRWLAALSPQQATSTPTTTNTPTPTSTATPTPDLAATYDFLSTQVAAGVDAALATRDAMATLNAPTPTHTPSPTPPPDLTATYVAGCQFSMEVMDDRPVTPRILTPGAEFVKRWTIRNNGACAWPADVRLVFFSGDSPTVLVKPTVAPLRPGESAEVEVTLRAPADFGAYTSVWQLQYGNGTPVGPDLQITYRVNLTPTPPPTATPTPTPVVAVTATPAEPLWMSIPGLGWCDGAKTGGRVEWGRGGGVGGYRYFVGRISPDTELGGPYNSFTGFPHVATYFTTSGTLVFPVPESCCTDDYGRYVSPQGYEVVWRKVWFAVEACPKQ